MYIHPLGESMKILLLVSDYGMASYSGYSTVVAGCIATQVFLL